MRALFSRYSGAAQLERPWIYIGPASCNDCCVSVNRFYSEPAAGVLHDGRCVRPVRHFLCMENRDEKSWREKNGILFSLFLSFVLFRDGIVTNHEASCQKTLKPVTVEYVINS